MSLNLWRFYDWEKRLPNIISIINEIKPDIIFTQETQLNISIDQRNQVEILNEFIKYPHTYFAQACVKTTRKGVPLPNPVDHGLGIFSKFPFKPEIIKLKQAVDDKEKRIVVNCDMKIDGEDYTISGVHFSNSDAWSEAHFKETLEIYKKRNIKPILAGDFNIKNFGQYKTLYENSYRLSSDEFSYLSYPKDGVSYDYVMIPKQYEFIDFQCRDEYVSDHRMITTKIKLLK
ncbi:MAG: endonuclease/exonuclease/phosphatase family protein [Minisyncoccia bacterium]